MSYVSGVKVFSATKARDREGLGDQVTSWIREHPGCQIVDKIVTQSSDSEFHCLTITLFYNAEGADENGGGAGEAERRR